VKKELAFGKGLPNLGSGLEDLWVQMVSQANITMKTGKTRQSVRSTLAAILIGFSAFVCAPANAAHESIYAVDTGNNLINFYSDAPANIVNSFFITGLQLNEEIRGIDYWNGTIYGLGSSSRLYTIDPNTGAATQVGSGQFAPLLNGQTFGFDNGPTGIQAVSGLGGGQNLSLNRATGVATAAPSMNYAAGDPFFGLLPRVDALAYDGVSGIWYAADTLQNTLALLNPTTGVLNTINMLGIDPSRFNGMDNSSFSGIMYMGTPAASSDPQANLYWINKTTGMASLIGQIGQPGDNYLIRGLTVIPEPSSLALLGLGAFGFWLARRRQ
jgi:hypothetical protein